MNKWYYIIGIALLVILGFIFWPSSKSGESAKATPGVGSKNSSSLYQNFYDDAPSPILSQEDKEMVRRLWPDVLTPRENNREAVRKEWEKFAQKYPENIFIPDSIKPDLSEKQEKERRKTLDAYTSVATRFAVMEAKAKNAQAGTEPSAPSTEGITPEQQKLYFDYKIKETQSKIDLMQYALDSNGLDNDQKTEAQTQMEAWKKDLEQYKKMAQ